jgi:hypothetical protein
MSELIYKSSANSYKKFRISIGDSTRNKCPNRKRAVLIENSMTVLKPPGRFCDPLINTYPCRMIDTPPIEQKPEANLPGLRPCSQIRILVPSLPIHASVALDKAYKQIIGWQIALFRTRRKKKDLPAKKRIV